MLKDGELIKINEDLCFARAALDKLREDYKAQLDPRRSGDPGHV